MKKAVAKWIALTMVVSMLGGCAGAAENESTSKDKDVSKSESSENTETGDAPTIKLTYITTGTEPAGLDRIEENLNELTMEKIGCNVEFVPVAFADQTTKYNMWAANGEDIDIVCTVFQDYLSMINAGAFVELDELIPEHAKDIVEKDKEKNFLAAGMYNGHMYGLATIPSAPGNGGALYLRKDIYDELDTSGIDENGYIGYEEMDSLFSQIAEKYPEYTAFGVSGNRSKSNYFYVKNYDNLGSSESTGVLVDALKDTTVENLYATDEYYEYLTWMRKWYEAGYISKDAATASESADELFNAGRTASYIGMSTTGTREGAELDSGTEVVQLNMCPNWMTTNVYTGVLFFVSKNSQNPEKAVELLNILFTDKDVINLLSNGMEGTEYEFVDKEAGRITWKDTREYINPYGVWGDQGENYVGDNQPEDFKEKCAEYLETSVEHTSLANGYKFDATGVSTEQATVKSVISKYLTQLEYGTVDLDTVYPEFLEELEKAGINTIIEENQKQLDAWLAEQ